MFLRTPKRYFRGVICLLVIRDEKESSAKFCMMFLAWNEWNLLLGYIGNVSHRCSGEKHRLVIRCKQRMCTCALSTTSGYVVLNTQVESSDNHLALTITGFLVGEIFAFSKGLLVVLLLNQEIVDDEISMST